jgi:hypothetical protein
MRRLPRILAASSLAVAVLGGLTLFMAPAGAEDPLDTAFDWRTDLDAAREEARTTGRPLLVVFR